ncbi:thiaminase II [Dysgonomonas sp. 216]|uniref:thiaminase II n=1 Tax=Dysgonomonas sp. 216 TaxID=2302934 RepID=UPI0013D77C2F|nr:thiaminase II [Dysgonomonas sp. 216]NDW19184.1 thiaminase II [Dysgonomonas sp. 216]
MKWSERTWVQIQPIYNNILKHPFIKELMGGTLDKEKFIFYIRQDAIYLSEYGKVLAGIASKLSNTEYTNEFLHFASDSVAVEKALHESFLKDIDKNIPFEASPGCLFYTSYLHSQLGNASVEVAAAAVLPCFWIYKEVGDYILANQTKSENPYQDWINTYGGDEFAESVRKAIAICDDLAEKSTLQQQEAMTKAFAVCSKMEWIFWDSAWRLEQWDI